MKQVIPISKEADRLEIPNEILGKLRALCLKLPEAYEESAWVGIRWIVGQKNFAHVLGIDSGWPPAYAKAAGTNGPAFVMTFQSRGRDSEPPEFGYYPFFRPVWFPNIVGMIIDDETDWSEVSELLKISFTVMAQKRLAALVSL
jgi:hypothetical protein